jgi:four helix bundle protein
MDIFNIAKKFPSEEKFSLVSQVIRSSRSVCANITEGWAKRKYEDVFKRFLIDAYGSTLETKTWLDFSLDCCYVSREQHEKLIKKLEVIGGKLHQLHGNWVTYK